jgi:hypothetical protein
MMHSRLKKPHLLAGVSFIIGRIDILGLFPKSFLGEILCRDRACPCPNPNEDSHPAKLDFAKLN